VGAHKYPVSPTLDSSLALKDLEQMSKKPNMARRNSSNARPY